MLRKYGIPLSFCFLPATEASSAYKQVKGVELLERVFVLLPKAARESINDPFTKAVA